MCSCFGSRAFPYASSAMSVGVRTSFSATVINNGVGEMWWMCAMGSWPRISSTLLWSEMVPPIQILLAKSVPSDGIVILPRRLLLPRREELIAIRRWQRRRLGRICINNRESSGLFARKSSLSVSRTVSYQQPTYCNSSLIKLTFCEHGVQAWDKIRTNESMEVLPPTHKRSISDTPSSALSTKCERTRHTLD